MAKKRDSGSENMTEQKQAEEFTSINETLRESEERLYLAMESGRVGVWEWEVGTERVEWSQGIYTLLGYQPGAVTPARGALRRRIHPDDLARHDQALKDSLERCEDYLCEFRVVWADGSVHWVEARGQYVYTETEHGIVLRMRGVLSDIDRRKQAEEALRDSEERHRRLLDNLKGSHFVYRHDTEGVFQYLSESVTSVLGYAPEEFMAHYSRFMTDHPANEAVHRHTDLSIQGIPQPLYEVNVWHKDGSTRWLEVQEVPVFDASGRVIAVEGVAQDITERKEAEESLRRSEEQFHRLFEDDLTGNFISTPEGRVLLCNPAFAVMFGFSSAQEAVGTSILDLYLDPREREPLLERLKKEGKTERLEVWRKRRDGEPIHIVENLVGHFDEQGQLYEIKGYLFEDTQRRRAEEALRELNATLESKVAQRTAELKHRARQLQKLALEMSEAEDRERERLAHILHDDLQQELAAAKFHLSIVRSRIKYDPSVQEIAAKVEEMLKDAIGKSRSLSHELSPAVLRQGDFAEILQWLAREMQAKHGLVVRVQGRARSQADAIKAFLYRAARELLFNVVKHARINEAQIRVRRCWGYICLSVSDRGRGFDPGKLRETGGFGLLSIRERIELLGGRMKIRSAPGQGSAFFVVVPDGGLRDEAAGARDEGGISAPRPPGPAPLRVLLADDHEVVRRGLVALLSEEETVAVVGEAANGREAVDLAGRLHPDVVLMDVSMPVMNGEEATRQIKQDLPRTRIVSLSMREEPEVRERMRQAGADSYVLKTAPYKELLVAIRGGQ